MIFLCVDVADRKFISRASRSRNSTVTIFPVKGGTFQTALDSMLPGRGMSSVHPYIEEFRGLE
jgi:hypothetical protein